MATVADQMASALKAAGVSTVWGMPGGDTLPLIDALGRQGLRFVLVRDEASAGFAADASAQLTGAVGACVATIGPGLSNMVSGVAGCTLDRAPVIAITSRYSTPKHGTYTHMMLDQTKLMDGSGKAWFRLTQENCAGEVRRALTVASAPRPGAVWLEVPTEVGGASVAELRDLPIPRPPQAAIVSPELVDAVDQMRRPVILVGFAGRHADILGLAERLRAPVFTTYKAKGAIPEGAGWSAGGVGLSPVADKLHQELIAGADGVVLVGWDPAELRDHWMPGWPDVPVVCLDEMVPTDIPSALDHTAVGPIEHLVAKLPASTSEWTQAELAAHRSRVAQIFDEDTFGPATAVKICEEFFCEDTVVALDVGAHRITASHVYRVAEPDRLLQSNGFASMGYGVPAAMAAAVAGHRAACIVGDMGIQMCMGELVTIANEELDVTVVVFDDTSLSLIELKQKRLDLEPAGVGFANPDWRLLARSVGGHGQSVNTEAGLRAALRAARFRRGLSIIAVVVDREHYAAQM